MACPQETFEMLADLLTEKHPDLDWDYFCFYNPPIGKRRGITFLQPSLSQLSWMTSLWWKSLREPYHSIYVATSDRSMMEVLRPITIFAALLPRARAMMIDPEGETRIGLLFAIANSLQFALTLLLLGLATAITRAGMALVHERSAAKPAGKQTAIVLPLLPDLSHTFAYREALELKRIHPEYRILALEKGDRTVIHPEAAALLKITEFVPKPGVNRYLLLYLKHWLRRPTGMARLIRAFQPHTKSVADRGIAGIENDALGFLRLRFFYHSAYIIQALIFADFVGRSDIGYIHVFGSQFPSVRALAAHELLGVPYSISTFVDYDYTNPFHMIPEKFGNARFVTVATDFCRRHLSHKFPQMAAKFRVMRPSLPLHYAENRVFRERDGTSRLIYIGRFVSKKGLDVLVKACAMLKERKVPFCCRLYGNGELVDHVNKLIRLYALGDLVQWEGALPNDRIYSIMNADDIFVSPCRYMRNGERDGIPVTLTEAMAAGITVVSTPVSGIPELIEPGVNGYLVHQNDPKALANLLEQLIRNSSMREAISEAARRTIHDKFCVENSVALLHAWINS